MKKTLLKSTKEATDSLMKGIVLFSMFSLAQSIESKNLNLVFERLYHENPRYKENICFSLIDLAVRAVSGSVDFRQTAVFYKKSRNSTVKLVVRHLIWEGMKRIYVDDSKLSQLCSMFELPLDQARSELYKRLS